MTNIARKGRVPSLQVLEIPAKTSISDFSPLKLWNIKFLLFWDTQFVVLCHHSPKELIQLPRIIHSGNKEKVSQQGDEKPSWRSCITPFNSSLTGGSQQHLLLPGVGVKGDSDRPCDGLSTAVPSGAARQERHTSSSWCGRAMVQARLEEGEAQDRMQRLKENVGPKQRKRRGRHGTKKHPGGGTQRMRLPPGNCVEWVLGSTT